MMKREFYLGLCLFILLFSNFIFASPKDLAVVVFDENYLNKEWPGTTIYFSPNEAHDETQRLPHVELRDSLFSKNNLTEEISSMDDLDRDLLWSRARALELDEIVEMYPKIKAEKLKSLCLNIKNVKVQ